MTEDIVKPGQIDGQPPDSLRSRLFALLSLALIGVICFELDWFSHNIYRHAPSIAVIKPETH